MKALVVTGRSKIPLASSYLSGGGYDGAYEEKDGEASFCSIWAFMPFRKKFDFHKAIWDCVYFGAAIQDEAEGGGESLEIRPSSRCAIIISERPYREIVFFVGDKYFRDPDKKKEGVIFSFFIDSPNDVGGFLAMRKRGYKRIVPIDKENIVQIEVSFRPWEAMRPFSSV